MKIAVVTTYFGSGIGGAEISTKLLVDELRKKEQVDVITLDDFLYMKLMPVSLKAFLLNTKFEDRCLARRIARKLKKIKPDVVHVQDLSILPAAFKAADKLGLKKVVTVRDTRFVCNLAECQQEGKLMFKCSDKVYKKCLKKEAKRRYGIAAIGSMIYPFVKCRSNHYRAALGQADKIIAISDFIKKTLMKTGVDGEKIVTMNNPAPDWKAAKKEKTDTKMIFAPGRLEEYKGFQVLIKAMSDIRNSVKLVIAGTGSYAKELKKLAKTIPYDERITFTGKLSYDEIKEHYSSCDVVAFPSLWPEPLGRVPLEAAAAKKPVVASNIGGIPEIVKKDNGVLVKPGDVLALRRALVSVLDGKKKFSFRSKVLSVKEYAAKVKKVYG